MNQEGEKHESWMMPAWVASVVLPGWSSDCPMMMMMMMMMVTMVMMMMTPAWAASVVLPGRSSDCPMVRTRLPPPPSYSTCCRLRIFIQFPYKHSELNLAVSHLSTYYWQVRRPGSRMESKCRNNLWLIYLETSIWDRIPSLSAQVTPNALLLFLISWLHPPSLKSRRKRIQPHFPGNDISQLLCGQARRWAA